MLKFLIFTITDKFQVLQFFYYYKHLNREDFINLSCINLITHRVRIVLRIKSTSSKSQKR